MDAKIYKAIIEQSSVMMIVMDTDLNIVVISDAYLNNTKTIRENIVGKNIFDVFPNSANETTKEVVDTIQNSFNHILKKKNDGTLVTITLLQNLNQKNVFCKIIGGLVIHVF